MFGTWPRGIAFIALGTIAAAPLTAPVAMAQSQERPQGSVGLNLRAQVPVTCSVRFSAASASVETPQGIGLGSFREYCNSPRGYKVVVSYAPGTLLGAELVAGSDRVVLDGSGRAVLSQASGPRVRERALLIAPGAAGFDSNRLDLDILPM